MFYYAHRAKPVVKWAGGKTHSLSRLLERFPQHFSRYLEPFVGGGAVFLSLVPTTPAALNDANESLMNLYRTVRDTPLELMAALDALKQNYSETFYYELRDETARALVKDAARFIFLNKTCYNGLYRTNSRGKFNVPFGKRSTCPALYDRANLLEVAIRLRNTELFSTDFESVIDAARENDLVYCDPPYLPASPTAQFHEYTAAGFPYECHVRLKNACERAAARGAYVVLSNAAVARSYQLYAGWYLEELEVPHSINAKAERRGLTREILARPSLRPSLAATIRDTPLP